MELRKKAEWGGVVKGIGIVVLLIGIMGIAMASTTISDTTITIGRAVMNDTGFFVGESWIKDGSVNLSMDASNITSGTLVHERGGLEADVSSYEGLLKIAGGLASSVTDNSTNWDLAYGWGNHSTAGYVNGSVLNATNVTSGNLSSARMTTNIVAAIAGLDPTLTSLTFDAPETIKRNVDDSYNRIASASAYDNGAYLLLCGGDYSGAEGSSVMIIGDKRSGKTPDSEYLLQYNANGTVVSIFVIDKSGNITTVGKITPTGDIIPTANVTYDLGSPTLAWDDIYAKTTHIGHIAESYSYNPTHTYEIGDVVAIDTDPNYDIKPSQGLRSRIIGAVARLPFHEEVTVETGNWICNGEIFSYDASDANVSCTKETTTEQVYIDEMSVAIYGKFSTVKVKGTIQTGDYLVASNTSGVATSMYNRAHPLLPSALPASTDPDVYNSIAKLLPNLGIAMGDYNSVEVGTITVMIGK